MIPYCIALIEDESDRAFMTRLFEQYQRLMYKCIRRIVEEPWDVDDVLQDVLEQLMKKADKLRGAENTWLCKYIMVTCEHRALNYNRYKKCHPCVVLEESSDVFSDQGAHREAIESRLIRESEIACFQRLWDKLDRRTQYILEGIYILEQSPEELAEELGMKPNSFRMAITRARRKAYARFQEAYEKGE